MRNSSLGSIAAIMAMTAICYEHPVNNSSPPGSRRLGHGKRAEIPEEQKFFTERKEKSEKLRRLLKK